MSIFGPVTGTTTTPQGGGPTTGTQIGVPVGTGLSPFQSSDDWDHVSIGGVVCPGIAQLDKVERKHDFDRKKGKGTQGETITFVQKPAAEFKVKFLLWLDDHFTAWQSFRPLLKYDPTKKDITAIEIYHPALADLEIHSVVCASLGGCHHDGKGLFSIEADFIEYFPAGKTNATGTPAGSKQYCDPPNSNSPGDNGKSGTDQLDAENKKLIDQAKSEGAL